MLNRPSNNDLAAQPTVHYASWRLAGEQLVNIAEHLAATESEVFLRSWWRPKPELEGGLKAY